MNKKSETGNQIMFFTFLFLLVIIGVGIVTGTFIYFGDEYDTREIDAEILNYKIRNCIANRELNKDSFYQECVINESSISRYSLILKVCVDSSDCAREENPFVENGRNFQACNFIGAKENRNFPKCVKRTLEINGKRYEIITGSNQFSRRINV